MDKELNTTIGAVNKNTEDICVNSGMIKEINFPEMLEKIRKFREDMDHKMSDLVIKMKKKVGTQQLHELEQTMVEKLDKFLSENEKNKAEKQETKDVLVFLENRVRIRSHRSTPSK